MAVLNERVAELISFFRQPLDFQQMIYEKWTAKNILGHLTFWHESFAKNLHDLAQGNKPDPLRGKLSEVNRISVETTAALPIEKLLERMWKAQTLIEQHITNSSIKSIPYKRGSRDYSRLEHLEIVEAHIKKHLRDLKKKMKVYGST